MITLRPVTPDDWIAYRQLRLESLRLAPEAFGSTYAAEQPLSDAAWVQRLQDAAASGLSQIWFACVDEQPAGLLWCKRAPDDASRAGLYQLWVTPAHQGRGLGRALIEQAIVSARQQGLAALTLAVTVADSPAWRLYQRLGFVAVGAVEPLRPGSALMSQTMRLTLDAALP